MKGGSEGWEWRVGVKGGSGGSEGWEWCGGSEGRKGEREGVSGGWE